MNIQRLCLLVSQQEKTHIGYTGYERGTSVFTASIAKDSLVFNYPQSAEREPPGNQVSIKSSACSERSEDTVFLNACLSTNIRNHLSQC